MSYVLYCIETKARRVQVDGQFNRCFKIVLASHHEMARCGAVVEVNVRLLTRTSNLRVLHVYYKRHTRFSRALSVDEYGERFYVAREIRKHYGQPDETPVYFTAIGD